MDREDPSPGQVRCCATIPDTMGPTLVPQRATSEKIITLSATTLKKGQEIPTRALVTSIPAREVLELETKLASDARNVSHDEEQ